ncbi:MAG: GGDEF domain-containing protein [Candidatus Cloacimonetes bacterium]|nr:GGDEF domain-containing protein [Candidatus Cloacimonadota bacterium]
MMGVDIKKVVKNSKSLQDILVHLKVQSIDEIQQTVSDYSANEICSFLEPLIIFLKPLKEYSAIENLYKTLLQSLMRFNEFSLLRKSIQNYFEYLFSSNKNRIANPALFEIMSELENCDCSNEMIIDIYCSLSSYYLKNLENYYRKENRSQQDDVFSFSDGRISINHDILHNLFLCNFSSTDKVDCTLNSPEDNQEMYKQKKNHENIVKGLNIAFSLYSINEYVMADNFMIKCSKLREGKDNCILFGIYHFLRGKISFMEGLTITTSLSFFQAIDIFNKLHTHEASVLTFLEWILVLNQSGFSFQALKILDKLINIYPFHDTRNYAKALITHFKLNIENYDTAIELANQIISLPTELFSPDELYTVYIYLADYYSNMAVNFDKALRFFEISNLYLKKSWSQTIEEFSYLQINLPQALYYKVTLKMPQKLNDFLAEESVHFSHYAASLRLAYRELESLYEKVKEMSLTDWLTNLNNRRYFWIQATQMAMLANRESLPVSFVIFDIDDFKIVNDTYGHNEGDIVLRRVADVIKSNFRESDIIVRFGGEEFLAMLFNSDDVNAKRIVQTTLKQIESIRFKTHNGNEFRITISAGICSSYMKNPKSKDYINSMIGKADEALYNSKINGKNRVTVYKYTEEKQSL